MNDIREQVVCLSALFCAIDAVKSLATHGEPQQSILAALLPSLIRYNQRHMLDYFDRHDQLNRGRALVMHMLEQDIERDYIGYSMQVVYIEKKLSGNADLMQTLQQGLQRIGRQIAHFGLIHETIFASIAELYQQTAGQAASSIMVRGDAKYLQQTTIVEQIRTLLMCAIRASALWRANGGNRWQLMFARRAILEESKKAFD